MELVVKNLPKVTWQASNIIRIRTSQISLIKKKKKEERIDITDVWHSNPYKYIKLLIHSRYSQDVIFLVWVL